jgi:hypothetical protein
VGGVAGACVGATPGPAPGPWEAEAATPGAPASGMLPGPALSRQRRGWSWPRPRCGCAPWVGGGGRKVAVSMAAASDLGFETFRWWGLGFHKWGSRPLGSVRRGYKKGGVRGRKKD